MKRALMLLLGVSSLVAAAPATAANDLAHSAVLERSGAAFVGVRVRMNIGEDALPKPTARLALSMDNYLGDGRTLRVQEGPSLELGLSRLGRADFYMGRQRISDYEAKLGIAPVAAVALGVSAVALGALMVSELDRRQCLLPERELCKE